MLGTILSPGYTAMKKIEKNPCPHEASIPEKTVINKINPRCGMFNDDIYFGEQKSREGGEDRVRMVCV